MRPKFAQSYFVEDSIEAAKHIKAILPVLNYSMKGTNSLASMPPHCLLYVRLKGTVNIILKQIYNDKVIPTTLQKRTMKKIIIGAYTKTVFSFNSKFYKQLDGVSI